MTYNKIYVSFGALRKITGPFISYQYDVQQILVINGLNLPEYYEVDFCNEGDTYTETIVGTVDGGVAIPNKFLRTGKKVKAYLVLVGDGDVQTRYEITLPVNVRPQRQDIDPTDDQQLQIDSLIAALNSGVASAEAAAQRAEDASVHTPQIVDGYWYLWDADTEQYVTSGVKAEGIDGDDGVGISSVRLNSDYTLTLVFTDESEYTTPISIRGPKGDPFRYDDFTEAQKAELVQGPILDAQTAAVEAVNTAGTTQTGNVNQAGTTNVNAVNQAGTTQVNAVEDKGDEVLNSIPQDYTDLVDDVAELTRQLSDLEDTVSTTQIINTASGAIASFSDGADDMPIKSLICTIEPVQAGSGDPSPTNVRPISGHTGAEIEQTGKNLFEPLSDVNYKAESGQSFNGYNMTGLLAFLNTLPVGNYIVSFKFNVLETVSGATSWGIFIRNSVTGYIDGRQTGQHNSGETLTFSKAITITTANKGQFANAYLYSGGGNAAKVYWYDFQLELGSTATDYEPYTGNQISVTFPETIYGGEDEVISGKLKSTIGYADMGTLIWNKVEQGSQIFFYAGLPDGSREDNGECVCSVYPTANNAIEFQDNDKICRQYGSAAYDFSRIAVKDSTYNDSTAADFKTAMNGVQLCYEFAEPVEYDLTPQTMETLYGTNNIWSSTGDTEVTYPADTKLYIDSKITQAIANALNS